jgi:phosphoribosylanthranilate isomerase
VSPLQACGRTAVKFCGITNRGDAAMALAAGADAIGVILAPSERRVTLSTAFDVAAYGERPSTIVAVVGSDVSAVPALHAAGFVLQFCSPIDPGIANWLTRGAPYLRVVHLDPLDAHAIDESLYAGAMPLFDVADATRLGGTGRTFAWERVAGCASLYPIAVAGGLNAGNVGDCVRRVRPAAVDVRSGIERRGRKSMQKMRAFVRAVHAADRDVRAA